MPYDPSQGLINGASLVGGLIAQGQQMQGYISGLYDEHAKRKAGEAVARGDYQGAASLLGSRGMIKEADATRTEGLTTDTLRAAATGDYGAAKTSAAAAGDPALYNSVNTAQDKEKADRATWLGHAADALLQIKDPSARHAAFQSQIAPVLKSMGVDDQHISQLDAGSLSDEQLTAFKTTLGQMQAMDIQTTADGDILGIDKHTGDVRVLHHGTPKPVVAAGGYLLPDGKGGWSFHSEPQIKTIKDADGTEHLVQVGGDQGGAASGATVAPTGGIYDHVAQVAEAAGAKPEESTYLRRLAQVESAGNPNAKNGSSTGLMQFHPDTFARAGGGDINSVEDQTKGALHMSRTDRATLQRAGIDPTDANVYIMHQQGPAGGLALLSAPPEVGAVAALTPVYGSAAKAKQAITNNGGSPDMTAGQFVDMWQKKWGGGASQAPANAPPQVKELYTGKSDGSAVLNDDTVDYVAQQYILSGQLPPLGMGKAAAANRDKILNRAADIEKETGANGADAVTRHLAVKSAGAALTKATNLRSAVEGFEGAALRNADLVLQTIKEGGAGPALPALNGGIQLARQKTGSVAVTRFNIALGTFADEYAKVVGGSTGNQQTTDSARAEAYRRFDRASTPDQLRGAIDLMRREMDNRLESLRQQERELKATIHAGGVEPQKAAIQASTAGPGNTIPGPAYQSYIKRFTAKKIDARKPRGDIANPYLTHNDTELNALPKGSYAIAPDGTYGVVQ